MTLKKIDLALGLRHITTAVLNRVQKASIDEMRTMRTIRTEFSLRQADHQIKKLGERLSELDFGIPWDVFIDSSYLADDIRDSNQIKNRILNGVKRDILTVAQDASLDSGQVTHLLGLVDKVELSDKVTAELEQLACDVLAIAEEAPYTLDSNYITWLLTQVKEVDLSVMIGTDREGKRVEVEVQVPLGQWELLADLADKLVGAVEVEG